MTSLGQALRQLVADLTALDLRWALVGGLAVSARAEPRTTRGASGQDLEETRAALALMAQRQTHRQKDLPREFDRLCAAARREAEQ